ncbi:HypC/HybG/HupF family hydrogenase formation chaperone [bacterium]|nr:HypC/HybG/HupF family hydrogenase formation chaperone [bacterium]
MCLSLPAKVMKVDGDMAEVSVGGAVFRAGVQMVDGVRPGDWVLLHAGFAIGKMKEEEALETLRLLDEIGEAGSGGGYTGTLPGAVTSTGIGAGTGDRTDGTDGTDGSGEALAGR